MLESVEEFLAYAIRLEREAADRFGQLADAMQSSGNGAVGKLFRQLSEYSRMHLAEAQARAGFRDMPKLEPGRLRMAGPREPGDGGHLGGRPDARPGRGARSRAAGRDGGTALLQAVRDTTHDPEILALAKAFVEEEAEHVAALERWIAAHKAGRPLPIDA